MKIYQAICEDALTTKDRDAFVSDWALSSAFGGDPDQERIELIGAIYDAMHRSVREIAAAAGMSQRKLAERFMIPYRTMENWCGGQNPCTDYARVMMQQLLGLMPTPEQLAKTERRYIVVDMPISGAGDSWTDIYDTAEDANREARGAWEQLSEADRRNRQIFAAVVSIDDLADYAEEDGKIDWACWENCNTFPGAFDSRKI